MSSPFRMRLLHRTSRRPLLRTIYSRAGFSQLKCHCALINKKFPVEQLGGVGREAQQMWIVVYLSLLNNVSCSTSCKWNELYYNHLGKKIAADLINSSSFLVPKATLKIISALCLVSTTCLHLVGSEGIIIAKPEWAPPASSSGGGRFLADPEQEREKAWLPKTVTCVLRFIWCLDATVTTQLIGCSSGHLLCPAHSFVLLRRHHSLLSKVLSSGYDQGLWTQTDLGSRVTSIKLLNLAKPRFPHL